MIFGCELLFDTYTLLEQCTYLSYFLLEAPREYVQHGPLLSIDWLRLCPQSGARVWSHAVWRRLFICIPNDSCSHFTQRLFPPKLPWQHTCTAPHYKFNLIHTYYTSHSDKQLLFLLHDKFTLSFLWFFITGRLPLVSRVRYISFILIYTKII